jgi:hypothetical protein
MMPSMAAAYATLSRAAIPRATTALNVLQRVGGSIGTALLAVVLQHQIRAAIPHAVAVSGDTLRPIPPAVRAFIAEPVAHAFNHTFWWAVVLAAAALPPAIVLARRARGSATAGAPARTPLVA